MMVKSICNLPLPSILLDELPASGADGLIEIPIAITGRWKRGEHEFAITRDDLKLMEANFRRRKNGEINIDYDHASEMPEVAKGGPIPSAGRIVKVRSNGALYASIEFTPRALGLIKNREYRFVSPAIAWGVKDKVTGEDLGTALTSLALTNRPFLEELPQIKLSEFHLGGEEGGREMASERISGCEGAQKELLLLTQECMREKKLRFREALLEMASEHPDIAERARQEGLSDRSTYGNEPSQAERITLRAPRPNEEKFLALVAARQREKNISYSQALTEIGRERPELCSDARAEVLRG